MRLKLPSLLSDRIGSDRIGSDRIGSDRIGKSKTACGLCRYSAFAAMRPLPHSGKGRIKKLRNILNLTFPYFFFEKKEGR